MFYIFMRVGIAMNILGSVKGRLVLLFVAISTLSTVLVGVYFIFSTIEKNNAANAVYAANLHGQFDRELKLQTQGLVSSLQAIYNEQKAGLLTEERAKAQAIAVIKAVRYDGDGYFFADSLEGVCVAHATLGAKVEGKQRLNDQDKNGVYYMKEIFKAAQADEGGGYSDFSFPKPNETEALPKRGFSMIFKPYGWVIATGAWVDHIEAQVKAHEAEANQIVYHQIGISIAILVFIQLCIVCLAMYLAKRFAAPILISTQHIEKLAAGDFRQQEASLLGNRADEFGKMEQAFKALSKNMYTLVQTIRHSAEKVTEDATQLSLSAGQSAEVSGQVAQSITEVAGVANKQLLAVESTAKVIAQLSAGMEEVAASAAESADNAAKVTLSAQDGTKAIEKSVEQMQLIEKTVKESAAVIDRLGDRSQAIGEIVDTIAGIAAQTNLLALNAAIEAARAGEQGRGFAVVAEEVRKLAEQSQAATGKIADLIGMIQSETGQAVLKMNEGTKEVAVGAAVVDAAGKSFADIVGHVDRVADQSKTIADTIQEMSVHTEKIVHAIQDVNSMNQNVVTEAENVSAATQEQAASVEEISQASETLVAMAKELETAIQKVKV